jgi:hypothetical protein
MKEKKMDWTQTYTIISTTLGGTLAACLSFYIITAKRMDRTDQMIDANNKNHREDMIRMDEKWERLFEKLLLKEQGKGR